MRPLRIRYTEHVNYAGVIRRTVRLPFSATLRDRRLRFFGHVARFEPHIDLASALHAVITRTPEASSGTSSPHLDKDSWRRRCSWFFYRLLCVLSHGTASSSAWCSEHKPSENRENGQWLTIWSIVYRGFPHMHDGSDSEAWYHRTRLAAHRPWPVRNLFEHWSCNGADESTRQISLEEDGRNGYTPATGLDAITLHYDKFITRPTCQFASESGALRWRQNDYT